jgi:hypothetical protein
MIRLLRIPAALACAALLSALPALPQPEPGAPLVLAGGTLIDVTNWGRSARDLPNAVVVIRDGRIAEAGPAASVAIPKGAQIIDCTGKFIIPGLVDGFAGLTSQAEANAHLYMGVTTVVAHSDPRRGFVDFAVSPAPHIYPIDAVGTTDNWSLLAHRPEWASKLREGAHPVELPPQDIARQMADTARLGTRVLFIGPATTAANTQWIVNHSHELHMAVYGDFVATPDRVGVEAGVDALVHSDHYTLGVIPDELQRPLVDDPYGPSANTAFDYSDRVPPTDARLRSYARFLAGHRTALLPTFSLSYALLPAHRNLWREPAAGILNPHQMYEPTNSETGEMEFPLPAWAKRLPAMGQRYIEADLQKKAQQQARRVWSINATIFDAFPHYLAGSGADAFGSLPGISLHTEMELLVRLGLSPREALAAATNNYALQFGWTELGQVAPGRRADILVVDGDPTYSIWNARNIAVLIEDGNVVDRQALLKLRR